MNQVYRTVFELSINLIETFMVIWFMSEFLGYRLEKPKRQIGFGIAWLVNFLELSYLNYLMPFEGLLAFIQILIYIGYARICSRVGLPDSCLLYFLHRRLLPWFPWFLPLP